MARIILFGMAVVGVLVVTLAYAVWSGQYEAEQPSPSASASGSLGPGPSPSAAASAGASGSVQAEPSALASGAVATVSIVNSNFGPDLTVTAGTTVTFTNNDSVAHTATEGSDGVAAADARFDLQLADGASEGYTVADPGTYQVTCTIHAQMNMTITVP